MNACWFEVKSLNKNAMILPVNAMSNYTSRSAKRFLISSARPFNATSSSFREKTSLIFTTPLSSSASPNTTAYGMPKNKNQYIASSNDCSIKISTIFFAVLQLNE